MAWFLLIPDLVTAKFKDAELMNTIKNTQQYSKQQGFTLVEIAIVLVIIGLLLGGVLKGQELANSARVRNMADLNSSVQAAYFGFIDRYRAIPGDMLPLAACNAIGASQMGVTSCAATGPGGNGNGRLGQGSFTEAAAVWKHLSASGFLVNDYTGVAGTPAAYTGATQNVAPTNPFSTRVLLGSTNQYLGAATVKLGFYMGRNTPVAILSELDTKIDDGRPGNGVLRVTTPNSTDYGAVAQNGGNCTTGTAPALLWDVSTDSQDCNAIYLY